MAVYELFFVYYGKHCKQSDGLGMSFPLGLAFANVFMCHFGKIWLENYPTQFKPVVYRSYVNDTFLLFHLTKLGSSMEKFHLDISCLKSVFKSNGYPKNFIDWWIKIFLDKLFAKNKVKLTVPKLQLVCVLPYTGISLLDLRARLRGKIDTNIPFCKLNMIFRSTCRLGNLSIFKDSLEKNNLSGIVNSYTCSNCKISYYGKTFRQCSTRAFEDMGTLNLTLKPIRNAKSWQYLTNCCNVTPL